MERRSDQLAKYDVIAFQLSEKEQAECPFALFLAQAIRCEENSCYQREAERQNSNGNEQHHAWANVGTVSGDQKKKPYSQRHQRKQRPHAVSRWTARRLPQL